ncbi:MAG: type II secretion system secretin GspD [Proteobacteria bacterium]|nr:type II secretion system secretin GspD [Pseudomonadota bacterium]
MRLAKMQIIKSFSYALALFFVLAFPLYAVEKTKELWNFDNADIEIVTKRVAEETKKNFIIDPRVQGKVTIISQQPLSPAEVYQVFLSVLRVHGFKAIESNNVVKIIPQDSANNDNGSVVTRANGNNDQQIVKVISLKYIQPNDMVAVIREMVPRTSHIVALNTTNHLIIADTDSNVSKVEKIIAQVDSPLNQSVDVVSVKHAAATELATTITSLLKDKSGVQRGLSINVVPDERTNSLVISGGTKEMRAYINGVIRKLDEPIENGANSEVIYLKYVQASNIAPIVAAFLEEALHANKEEAIRAEGKQSNESQALATATISQPAAAPSFPNHLKALKDNADTGGAQGTLFTENENRPKSGIINRFVQWEETTNSIIVKAPPVIMQAIKTIVAKLDIRRPQVIIEVVIAEVQLDRLEDYGVEWDVSPNASIKFGTRFFDTQPNINGTSGGIVGGFAGGAVEQLASGITVGIFRHGNLRALIRALASDTSANILSTPTLVTLDNQTALIKVGQKVPFAVGQTNNQNTGGNPFTSFDREEVGLSLTIKPQIINTGEIKLQIENILSNIVPNSANAGTGGNPTTNERTIITNVLVNEGKILVLGGLIQDTWQESKSQVPFLGRIPWIGNLFKSESKQLVKRNLMVFLRPKIIYDNDDGVRVSTKKYEQTRRAQLESYDVLDQYFIDEPITPPPLSESDYYAEPRKHKSVNLHDEVILPPPF